MARSFRALRRIQISNPEDTPGTAEAAVEPIAATITHLYTDQEWHKPENDRGSFALNVEDRFEVQKMVELQLTGELYDRLAVMMFSNAVRGNVTPTQPDAVDRPNEYLWLLEPNMSAPNTPDETNGIDTFTMEYGDNVQAYEAEYCFATELEITGEVGGPVEFTWTMNGRQVTDAAFTAALADLGQKYFAFNNTKFFIDSDYASIGTTQINQMLRAFTITFETMFTARFAADGTLLYGGVNEDKKQVQAELTFYRDDTNSEAERDKYDSQAFSFARIQLNSNNEMDAGQSNPEYINLDMALKYSEWPELEDEDGASVVTVSAETFLDPTSSKQFGFSVGTTMAAFAGA